MPNLTQASRELFTRRDDERFSCLQALWEHCRDRRERSLDHWCPPQCLEPDPQSGHLNLTVGHDGAFHLNDWSFAQLCRLAGVSRDTINRLSPETAAQAFRETLPQGNGKPLQLLTADETVRSIHGVAYTRLWNVDLLTMLREYATDFQPPPVGVNGGTGLYAGEQDMFVFLIDPTSWAEIEGETFAPGFFLWNSEVGRRTVGVSTFWFQAVCQNHIVWDAAEVVEFTRKHTARVHESLNEVRRIIEALVAKRDARRDAFVSTISKAMATSLGEQAEEVTESLTGFGLRQNLAKKAVESARTSGRLTVFSVVDALTRLAQEIPNAGDRCEAEQRAARLFALAA